MQSRIRFPKLKPGARRELAWISSVASVALQLSGRKRLARAVGLISSVLHWWPSNGYSYRGKTAVISGGSRGLGYALARSLIQSGANVILLARDVEELERAKRPFPKLLHHRILTIACDSTKETDLKRAIDQAISTFGQIDLWFNVAGAII